jgi:hypothetical protein
VLVGQLLEHDESRVGNHQPPNHKCSGLQPHLLLHCSLIRVVGCGVWG